MNETAPVMAETDATADRAAADDDGIGMPEPEQPGAGTAAEAVSAAAGAEALREAGEIIAIARRQAERIEHEAFARGFASGMQKGQADFTARARQMMEEVRQIENELRQQLALRLEQLEPEVLELSLAVAEKILSFTLAHDEQAFVNMTRSALNQLKNAEKVMIHVSETDLAQLEAALGASQMPGEIGPVLRGEPNLAPGSLVIESESGTVDASVQVQLTKIRQVLEVATV
jgi:flagellar assembly protein FliH